jgi:hypothetical protein
MRLSRWMWLALLAVGACDGGSSLNSPDHQSPPGDSLLPPADTSPPAPPPDSAAPPTPPPDTAPLPPAGPPVHTGIPFGPFVYTQHESRLSVIPPSELTPGFSALVTAAYTRTVMAKLEAARRSNSRILLNFSGSSNQVRDDSTGGFSLTKWKQQVDRYRKFDFSSYIADGTLIGHFLMDEPDDRNNWNGHLVSPADIEAMAKYSKEIWPDLPAIIRAWPDYLDGQDYQYLDAAWAQYHERFGPIDAFIEENVRGAQALGLALVMGLNVLAGSGEGGLPGYHTSKWSAMTASQVRTWGGALLDQPYICAFIVWRYPSDYFELPDVQEAIVELGKKAATLPKLPCRRS